MTARGLAVALLAALLSGCGAIPPAAIGGIAGAVTAAFRFDDDLLKLVIAPAASHSQKGNPMPPITLPTDAIASIPVVFTDQIGRRVAVPPGGSVTIDNTGVATAALSGDGSTVTVTPVAVGSANLTYTNGTLTTLPLSIDVVTPSASSVSFGDPVVGAPPTASAEPTS